MLTRNSINTLFCKFCGHKTYELEVGSGNYICTHCLAQGSEKTNPFKTGFGCECSLATLHYQNEPEYPSPILKIPGWLRDKWIQNVRFKRQELGLEWV